MVFYPETARAAKHNDVRLVCVLCMKSHGLPKYHPFHQSQAHGGFAARIRVFASTAFRRPDGPRRAAHSMPAPRDGPLKNGGRARRLPSALEGLLQHVQFVVQLRVLAAFVGDLADRVQYGGVIAAAE